MKNSFATLLLVFVTLSISSAQVIGKMFPNMDAETVEDKKVKLPDQVKGKYKANYFHLLQNYLVKL